MGLDLRLQNPTDESDSMFVCGGGSSVIRIVKDMNHYSLIATSGKTLREVKFDILQHIGVMMSQIDTHDYVPTSSRHDHRWNVTLVSDLELMAQLVGELNKVDAPDNWIVEWDY